MVRTGIVAYSLFAFSAHAVDWSGPDARLDDPSLNLLQLKAQKTVSNLTASATTRSSGSPGDREREMCPHEMTEAQRNFDGSFGCSGTMRAKAIKECSFWGEPHVSKTFPTQEMENIPDWRAFDVLYKPGLFRMAAADDGSWEVQVQNCGAFVGAVAARFGKHILEVVAPAPDKRGGQWRSNQRLTYFLDGEEYKGDFPIEKGQLFVDNTHRKALHNGGSLDETQTGGRGSCIDDPSGQFYLDIYMTYDGNLNVLMEVKDGSYTTSDGQASLCNVELRHLRIARYLNWPLDTVKPEDSLFITAGQRACEFCKATGWWSGGAGQFAAQAACDELAPKEYSTFTVDSMCQQHGISVDSARAACVHLKDNAEFFVDCALDFCAADGNPEVVEEAEQEEHAENPQPVCAAADDGCDPAASCCSALKDQAILDFSNVLQNNLCGDDAGPRELRFGSVLTQKGQVMDLVVTPAEGHSCGRATNAKNGAKSADIGRIGVQAGTEATFNFAFVKGSTDTPATPESLMFSFLDIDQGKKGKQRESVEVCGAVNAFVTDNSELDQSKTGNCIKFTSTTHGTGVDNPDRADSMSDSQRARTVAFQIAGSSFQATLGVSKKGRNPRRFMFAGNPTVACVLK